MFQVQWKNKSDDEGIEVDVDVGAKEDIEVMKVTGIADKCGQPMVQVLWKKKHADDADEGACAEGDEHKLKLQWVHKGILDARGIQALDKFIFNTSKYFKEKRMERALQAKEK